MGTLKYAQQWIEQAWSEMGRNYNANLVPVSRYQQLDVDDLAFPFKNPVLESWFLENGVLVKDTNARIDRVPYIAFSVDEGKNIMNIQVNWASRCGYGFIITFCADGKTIHQKMRWIS